jgi:hypothetical protein
MDTKVEGKLEDAVQLKHILFPAISAENGILSYPFTP